MASECGDVDSALRDVSVVDVCLSLATLGPDIVARAARSLAALVGRYQPIWSLHPVRHICFHGSLSILERKDRCLEVIADALTKVSPRVAADLAIVIASLAANHQDDKCDLLLQMIPALTGLVETPGTNAAATEALYIMSKSNCGQEAIIAAHAVPLLLNTALEAQPLADGSLCFREACLSSRRT